MSDTTNKKPTLSDDDISTGRRIGRRSFLVGALGGATAVSACVAVPVQPGGVLVGGYTDSDNGATTDPGGFGRGPGGRYTGITDSDFGNVSDRANYGRGGT